MPASNPTPYPSSQDADHEVHSEQPTDGHGNSAKRTQEQLSRLAEMVAAGELPLPDDLRPDQLDELVRDVRKRRHRRLVRYIARAIALDIHQSREHYQKGYPDVTQKI